MSFDHLEKQIFLLNLEILCIYAENGKSLPYKPIHQQSKASSILFFVHMYICFQRWPYIYGNTCKLDLDNYYTHILSKAVHKFYNLF